MVRILSVNDSSMSQKKNIIKDFWQSFLSLSKFDKLMLITVFLITAVTPYIISNHQTFTSRAAGPLASITSGNWSDPAIWSGGVLPLAGDAIMINPGHTVTYDMLSDVVFGQIHVEGTLQFSRTVSTRLKLSSNLHVMMGGFLDIGTADSPIPRNVRAEVIFVLPKGYAFTGGPHFQERDTGLWAMEGGRWESHGAPLLRTWSKLSGDVPVSATTVTVENDVTDWYAGGSVVVTQTSSPAQPGKGTSPPESCHSPAPCWYVWENEVRVITALTPLLNGRTQITLNQPLVYAHQGMGKTRGEVGLLTRNILIRTEITGVSDAILDNDLRERRFAHTMIMHQGSMGKVQYTEFKYMGHLGTLARYPIHLHQVGIAGKDMVVRGNSIWRSGNRGYQLHDVQGSLWEDNVSFDTTQSPLYVERTPGGSAVGPPSDNSLVHNLAVQSSAGTSFAPAPGTPEQNDATILWFDTLDQIVLGNVLVGGGSNVGRGAPQGSGTPEPDSNGGGLWVPTSTDGTGKIRAPVFFKNEMHSNAGPGFAFWQVGSDILHDFGEMMSWRNGGSGIRWGYYRTPHRVFNAQLLDNFYSSIEGGHAGSASRYMQDSEIIDNKSGWGPEAISIGTLARPTYPDNPMTYVRVLFENIPVGLSRPTWCSDPTANKPIGGANNRGCDGWYTVLLQPTFRNSLSPILFKGDSTASNKNSFWRITDAQGLDPALPKDFLLMQQDQQDPANRTDFTSTLLFGATMSWNAALKALVVPTSSFAGDKQLPIYGDSWTTSAGLLPPENRLVPRSEFTFFKTVDYPPLVSLAVTLSGKTATLQANATDDKAITRVEFYLNETLIATDMAAPYEATYDLSAYPRKYAYFYAKAYDGVTQTFLNPGSFDNMARPWTGPLPKLSREQVAYTKAVEIGPEVLAPAIPAPTPTPTGVPSATPTPTPILTGIPTPTPPPSITIQAESMTKVGGYIDDPSNSNWIKVDGAPSGTPSGTVTTPFVGVSGTYRIDANVIAEDIGRPTLEIWTSGVKQSTLIYPLGKSSLEPLTLTGPTVDLTSLSEIKLVGTIESGASARIDSITLTPVSIGGPLFPTPTNTPTPTPILTPVPTNTPTPTSTPTPTPLPTSTPIPTSTPTPTPKPTSTPIPTPVPPTPTSPIPPTPTSIPLPTPIPIACTITSASWISSNPIVEGTTVTLTAATNNSILCAGKQIAFDIRKDNGLLPSEAVDVNPIPANIIDGAAIGTWVSEFHPNGLFGLFGSPKYFFNANIAGDAKTVKSNAPNLQVDKSPIIVISTTPKVLATENSVTLTWDTNKKSSSRVKYGIPKLHRKTTTETDNVNKVTSHSVTISNLKACALYHYQVVSKDASLATAASSDSKFTTLGCNGSVIDTAETDAITDIITGGKLNLLDFNSRGVDLLAPPAFSSSSAYFQILKLNKNEFVNNILPPVGFNSVGDYIYHLNALGDDEDTKISPFNKDITVKINYSDQDIAGIDENSLTIQRWDGKAWILLTDCTLDTANKSITCNTVSFSDFVLFGKPLPTSTPTPTSIPSSGGGGRGGSSSGGGGGGSSGGSSGGGTSSGGGGGGGSSPAGADLNRDGRVNIFDLSILLRNWGKSGTGDLNSDGRVNIFDLSVLLRNWGR